MRTIDDLTGRILAGDTRAVARAATLIENESEAGRELIGRLFPRTGHALTVGITGPPGAGKSTLVSAMVRCARKAEKRVAVLAVDPSSAFSGGAILGDRIRMQEHHGDPGVFIRSLAARGHAGGVAAATFDLMLLLDAAGFDLVLIETVGVGQGELAIAELAAVTVVVLVPGLGDDVQALKAGIMEIADVFAINKADHPGAERLENEIRQMQSLGSDHDKSAPVRCVVATHGTGVEELLKVIEGLPGRRGREGIDFDVWLRRLRFLTAQRAVELVGAESWKQAAERVARRESDPYRAAAELLRSVERF